MNVILNLISKIPIVGLYILGVISIVSGDVFAKLWSKSQTEINGLISMACYVIGGFVFITIVKHSNSVGISNVIWNLVGIAGTLLCSYFIFHEPITMIQGVGVLLACVAIGLISY